MRFRILGSIEVWQGGRQVAIGGPQQRALLALLLLSANRVVSVDRLIAALWSGQPPPDARALVHGCVARLRRALSTTGAAGQPLLTRAPGYLLRVGPGELDLDRFDELATAATELVAADTAEALHRASTLLGQALALWRGQALSDVELNVGRAAVDGLEERRLAALEERLDIDIRLGRHAAVVGELREQVAAYPLRERLRGLLMLALYHGGRQAEALAVYVEARRLLVKELGIEPSPQLQRLHQAILADRDVDTDVSEQPPAHRTPTPRQLPAPVRQFAGRDAELVALTDLVDETTVDGGTVVISAIAGTAGVGKTALAVHWAHRVADRFPDGQLYVNLRGFDPAGSPVRPAEAVRVFLDALDVPPQRIPAELAAQTALYRSTLAGKRILIILDNARDTEQARPLLPGSPGCLAIVTSRNQLSSLVTAEGAHLITLDVLSTPDARSLIADRIGPQRVAAEPDAVAKIITRCAGLPLALAIVASRATRHSGFPLAALADELRQTAGGLDAFVDPEPTADIRTVFACSYQMLSVEAARLFRLIALHPGADFGAGAAASLLGVPTEEIRAPLTELTHAHMVTEYAPGRFTVHDLLRDYAAEQVRAADTESERTAAAGRLLDWYLHAADAATRMLYPDVLRLPPPKLETPLSAPPLNDRAEALDWLHTERRNLHAIARYAASYGPRSVAWLLSDALHPYFTARVYNDDWLELASIGLTAARVEENLAAQAAAQLSLGDANQFKSQFPQAIDCYTQALEPARRAGWTEGQAAALSNLANVYARLGRLPDATDRYTAALPLYQRAGDLAGQARNLGGIGFSLQHLGRLPEAADHMARALALFRQIGSRRSEAVALGSLGEVYHNLGRLELAAEHLVGALNLFREIGDRVGEAEALGDFAAVHRDTGDVRQAIALAAAALSLAREIGAPWVETDALNTQGSIEQRTGEHQSARDFHLRALTLARRTDALYPQTEALIGLTAAHQHLGEVDRARECAEEALGISRRIGYRVLEGQAVAALAAVELDPSRPGPAAELARTALDIHRETGHRLGMARAHLLLGRTLRQSDPDAAAAHWQQALTLFTDIGTPEADDLRSLLSNLVADAGGAPPHPR